MKFPKKVPVVGANGPFYSNFAPAAASQECIFFNFAYRVHIISWQMKCKTYGIFKSFFNLGVLYCTPNLICSFDHLPTVSLPRAISYIICLYSLTLNLTRWGCAIRRQKWRIHIFQRRSLFVANQIF